MDPLFQVHRLNDEGQARAGSVAKAFNTLVTALRKKVPPGRELAICEMKLEEACFFAKKGIASVLQFQKQKPQRTQRAQRKNQELKAKGQKPEASS